MLIPRFILGALAMTAVWQASRSFAVGDLDALALATLFSVTLSSIGSWLSFRLHRRRDVAPAVFAAPFGILAFIYLPSIFRADHRSFVFWLTCTIVAFFISLCSDTLIFRKIVDKEENS